MKDLISFRHQYFEFCIRYLDTLERSLANGETVLIENLGEEIEAVLDPVLGRNTIKKG